MASRWSLLLTLVVVLAPRAHATTPEALFVQLSPSIWFVYGFDEADDRRVSLGSGVVIGPQRVITNCHVLKRARTVAIRKDNIIYVAKLEYSDIKRDLCQLEVPNLTAPAVQIGSIKSLKVGQKVYALGNPRGLDVTFSDGLVSALRAPDGKEQIIQTTAPISPGSSGGGLFTEDGVLVGITTSGVLGGGNLNFAVPADWVSELPERTKVAAQKRKEQVAALQSSGVAYRPAAIGLPLVGATWKYRYTDRKFSFGGELVFSVRVTGVDGWLVDETLTPQGAGSSQARRTSIGAEELRFFARSLPAARNLVEFAPYLPATLDNLKDSIRVSSPTGYPADNANSNEWQVTTSLTRGVELKLPAGEFQTTRVDLDGTRRFDPSPSRTIIETGHFHMTAWYSTETRRVVRIEHQVWYGNAALATDEVVELLEFTGS